MSDKVRASETFYAELKIDGYEVTDVMTKLYLPRKFSDKILFQFFPSDDQAQKISSLLFWKFSVTGKVRRSNGDAEKEIFSENVYSTKFTKIPLGFGITEYDFSGEPTDLRITHFVNHTTESQKVIGRFWISPSRALGPDFVSTYLETGDVSIKTVRSFDIATSSELHLKFQNHFKRHEETESSSVLFHELVASFEIEAKGVGNVDMDRAIEDLEDVLLIASIASRSRCVCLGWDAYDFQTITTQYLRDRTVPATDDSKSGGDNDLISVSDFSDFVKNTFKQLRDYPEEQALRRALSFIVPTSKSTTEANFALLYSALEMLVLHFRREHRLERIMGSGKFDRFQNEIKTVVNESIILTEDQERREVISKLAELNRISFASAFKSFCDFYSIDLSDLWPVNDSSDYVTLSQLRNQLVHGEHFSRVDYDKLMFGLIHLRWIVERMILGILKWPIKKSNVSPGYLVYFTAYNNWKPIASKEKKQSH